MNDKDRPTTKNPTGLARLVTALLYACLVGVLIRAIESAFFVWSLSEAATPSARIETFDPLQPWPALASVVFVASYATMGAWLAASVAMLMWIYRVNANAQALTIGMASSPVGAIGWYFVPFANLWKPFRGVEEAWLVSDDPAGWSQSETPALLRWWWGLWLATGFAATFAGYLYGWADSFGEARLANIFVLISDLLTAGLVIVVLELISRLTAKQSAALKRHSHG